MRRSAAGRIAAAEYEARAVSAGRRLAWVVPRAEVTSGVIGGNGLSVPTSLQAGVRALTRLPVLRDTSSESTRLRRIVGVASSLRESLTAMRTCY